MNASFRRVYGVFLPFTAVGVVLCAAGAPVTVGGDETAELELQLDSDTVKVVSVALGQSATEVGARCKPAKVYADDDPWLSYRAAGGGAYVLFFSHEDTGDRLDPRRGTLYAVAHTSTESRDDGAFLLPEAMRGRACGDFVTLKVRLGRDKVKVATVALAMSTRDVTRLFPSASDGATGDHRILYDSFHGGRYLLVFSPQDPGNGHDPPHDRLSEVMYRPGGPEEAVYLLPRSKRGKPLPAEHAALLGNVTSQVSPNQLIPPPQ